MQNISLKLSALSTIFSVTPISRFAKTGFNFLVDIKQIRRRNMLVLIGEGTRAAFASKVGTDPAYISQILSEKTKADVGDRLARSIEDAYQKPYGWMDRVHGQAEELPQNEMADAWGYLLPEERAELEADIKRRAAHNKAVGEMIATQLVNGARKPAAKREPKIIDTTLPDPTEFSKFAEQRSHERRMVQVKIDLDRRARDMREK